MKENDTLSAKQLKAITSLLSHPTIRDAAKDCGVSETTLWRWLNDEAFQSAYRQARRSVVERAIGELQASCTEAVTALRRNLTCGNASTEVTAAKIILEQSAKGIELLDLQERLAELEQLFATSSPKKVSAV